VLLFFFGGLFVYLAGLMSDSASCIKSGRRVTEKRPEDAALKQETSSEQKSEKKTPKDSELSRT